jgi:hypothetical protein
MKIVYGGVCMPAAWIAVVCIMIGLLELNLWVGWDVKRGLGDCIRISMEGLGGEI